MLQHRILLDGDTGKTTSEEKVAMLRKVWQAAAVSKDF